MFSIKKFWDGTPCENPLLQGTVEIEAWTSGMKIVATLPHQPKPNVPDAPAMTRVANLWEYDVVECFLVGDDKYLEVELGAGGHFLVLDFTAPRVRDNDYEFFQPEMEYEPNAEGGRWKASIKIPWDMVPKGLKAMNAFVIVGENYLCYHPLPGPKADFHQPDRFPSIPNFPRP